MTTETGLDSARINIDLEALRKKYREERDKRATVADRANYTYLDGELAERFDTDPWAPTDGARDPVTRDVEALVIGGGILGLITAGTLRKNGIAAEDVCIVERGSDFGGTWYWNRYPGLACDTESYVYMPFLEETGYIPSQKYANGAEIRQHCERVGKHFDLYRGALFQTQITDATWDEEQKRWIITTDRGDSIRAHFLFRCNGLTANPKLPGIPGLDDYKGHTFHTMRWDYPYTGGSQAGNLTGLADKRVGLIGTGATSIQAVPPLGESAKELFVFQRTPSSVNVRANRPTDPEWAASLKPGWQRERMENFINIVSGIPQEVDLVDDGWTQAVGKSFHLYEEDSTKPLPPDIQERLDAQAMEDIRARVDEIVEDPKTAAALKPWYGIMCKRPCFHDEYLQTFNRPNVTLVDTEGRGVERITERGVIANGQEYELDCIIFATGFDVSGARWKGPDPKGVGGMSLTQYFQKSRKTLHGLMIPGFPNMFMMNGPGGTLATTVTYGFVVQAEHCARILNHCRAHGVERIEPKQEAVDAWAEIIEQKALRHEAYYEACTPGYYNLEGAGSAWGFHYGEGSVAYARKLDEWYENRLTRDLHLDETVAPRQETRQCAAGP